VRARSYRRRARLLFSCPVHAVNLNSTRAGSLAILPGLC
jgi:hypothetical protein